MNISSFTFLSATKPPQNTLFPTQTHSANIVEIVTGEENLENCDGLFTRNPKFLLGVQTADCAAVCFIGNKYYGVVHAGWRGLQQGILEKMLNHFEDDKLHKIVIAPLYPEFEVQKDECYELLHKKFGDDFFQEEEGKTTFLFLKAVQSVLPFSSFCGESTFENRKWTSWRRDKTSERNKTIVGNLEEKPKTMNHKTGIILSTF